MVSVDTVYQRVLALANKEQRGYITPQEYNLFANQAQMEIFEEYFHHLNQYLRNPGNQSNFSDSVDYIEDKISRFEVHSHPVPAAYYVNSKPPLNPTLPYGHILPSDETMYRLTRVEFNNATAQQTTSQKYDDQLRSVYAAQVHAGSSVYVRSFGPTLDGVNPPVGFNVVSPNAGSDNFIRCYNQSGLFTGVIQIDFIRMPKKVHWDYVVVNEKALYNANGAVNFDLHPSEETNLVYRILQLGGITINKPGLASLAKAEVVEQSNNEKS